ncbi:SpoIIE family protein phosphatase [Natronosporangium hydrolyticum]|uniref:SpoIIE family protein phosphatase n=1 Tax=Natronosporangium hydrolyticum TaxID=2811111 RepID=A0A895YCP0_9ACTN|nr:SpoIIE family protein phosphatase [Natronosporangium hydrolyticum]QSB13213.1 SpoIIE family protein phosphatase [Natronosporangium hydrolyticum]
MQPTEITLTDPEQLPEVLAWVRAVANQAGVSPLARGRLVLAVTDLIREADRGRYEVRLTAALLPGAGGRRQLEICAGTDDGAPAPRLSEHAEPAALDNQGRLLWRIPTQPIPATADQRDERAHEQELRAALNDARRKEDELSRLEAELAETNRGVVALYIELEERDEQLRTAHRDIFRSLEDALRPPSPALPGFEFGVYYAAAEADAPTGGDLYDWTLLPNGDLQISVVDVVGHGVDSTRDALDICHALRILGLQGEALPTLIERTSDMLVPTFPDLMATVLVARLAVATGELLLAGGGHPPLLLAQPGEAPTYLHSPGRGVGYPLPGTEAMAQTRLQPGATALLYTDGLIEATGDIHWGMTRLVESTVAHLELPPPELAAAVAADLHQRVRHTDDTMLLVVRWHGH